MILSKRGIKRLGELPCFSFKFCIHVIFNKKYCVDGAVFDLYGTKDEEFHEKKKAEIIEYHKGFLSELVLFNGEYFEMRDLSYFTKEGKDTTVPYEKVCELFNRVKHKNLPTVSVASVKGDTKRVSMILARWNDVKAKYALKTDREILIVFAQLFQYCGKSKFLSNQEDFWNKVHFNWIFNKTNFEKILSGQYNDKPFEVEVKTL